MSPVIYRFDPVGLDAWDRREHQPIPGTLVIKKHPGYGCPPQGAMGHCFVVPADRPTLSPVLVLEASLKRVDET